MKLRFVITLLCVTLTSALNAEENVNDNETTTASETKKIDEKKPTIEGTDPRSEVSSKGIEFERYTQYKIVSAMAGITSEDTGLSSCNYQIEINRKTANEAPLKQGEKEEEKLPPAVLFSSQKDCIALAGTEIEIRGQEGDTVYFNVVNHVDLSPEDEDLFGKNIRVKGSAWSQNSNFSESQRKLLDKYFPVGERDQLRSRLVVKDLQYKVNAGTLSRHIEPHGIWLSDLKAVLIPQKFYERKVYSSSQTIGIAASLIKSEKRRKQDRLMYDPSFEVGAGLTQATVDTKDGSKQKFGFALFAGLNLVKGDTLNFGLYYGHDFISLDEGESVNKATDETPGWIGIVLSTSLQSSDTSKNTNTITSSGSSL